VIDKAAMRILLVEDDEPIAEALVANLSEQNYVVDVATDGEVGWNLIEACAYDLILLDLMLPKVDGITLCHRLRAEGYQMPILLVTAKDSTEDKVKGLDAGADDYMVKPFKVAELTARIRALLRRGNSPLPPVLEWGQLQLNPSTCEVHFGGKPVTLTPTEYRLLELFLRNSNRVYSRSAILDHLWSFEEPPAEDTIRAHIKGLRQKLKAVGAPADLIETVYGLGYRLKALPTGAPGPRAIDVLVAGLDGELVEQLRQRLSEVEICSVQTGEETLEQLGAKRWSLLTIAHRLSNPAAVEVLRQAGTKGLTDNLPIVYCVPDGTDTEAIAATGKKRKTKAKKGERRKTKGGSEAIAFVGDPVDGETLVRQIADTLQLSLNDPPSLTEAQKQQTQAAVAKVWERFKDRICDRVTIVEQAAIALKKGHLDNELRQSAHHEAHKLVGSLGTFGFNEGSQLARQVEQLLDCAEVPEEKALYFADLVVQLRAEIDDKRRDEDRNHKGSQDERPLLLVVDDDRELSEPIAQEAGRWGMKVLVARQVAQAREAIARRRPDVVLLDISLPVDPGGASDNGATPEALEAIPLETDCTNEEDRKQEGLKLLEELTNRTPPVPVLVSTVHGSVEDRLEVARLGGRAFLEKPVPPSQVMEAVTQVLQRTHTTEAQVMVVDDDPQILTLLRTFLEPWGMRLITLSDPQRFWDTLELSTPDLIVLDVEMPHMSGIELCQVVRNDPRWSGLPVLFLTGHTDPETVHQVFASGADDYVSKPIVGPELVTRIVNRLERTQLLRNMAETDALTGVANRRKSTQELGKYLHQAERHDRPLCLAILDLDRFKQVNDRYGHATGDAVLRQFGKLLLRTFRSEDVVARWGGEEFIVGMYGMTKHEGLKRLNQVLQMVNHDLSVGPPEDRFYVTFSAGISEYPEDGKDIQSLYRTADKALYQAKDRGRNCVLAY